MHPNHSATLAEIAAILGDARRVLALCHVAPDGDAIGSLLGFGWLMRQSDPARTVTLVSADGVPPEFEFLPGAAEIVSAAPNEPFDVVVTLDASDARRLGDPFRPSTYGDAPVLVLDHHITNLYFGAVNYVDPAAAATSQIIVALADALASPISYEMAVCLLTGLATDTLGFRTSNTTPDVMRTAIRLMEAGANLSELIARTLTHRPLAVMQLWGLALAQLQHAGRAVWCCVSEAMRAQAAAPEDAESGLVSFLIGAPEANVAAVFSERPNHQVDVSMRARPGYDVSRMALSLGGGGHPQASGCTLPGALHEVEAQVAPLLIATADQRP